MAMNRQYPAAATIHDCLSLGDVEGGLSIDGALDEQRHRLPILLRLLSASRSHASIPTFAGWKIQAVSTNDNSSANNTSCNSSDALVDQVVSKLEDIAATHSGAEAMDMVALSIVPSVTRRICRVPPLRRKRIVRGNGSVVTMWDTQELAAFHSASPSGDTTATDQQHSTLKRQSSELVLASSDHQISDDEQCDDNDDDDMHHMDTENEERVDEGIPHGNKKEQQRRSKQHRKSKSKRRTNVRESLDRKRPSEDSPEAMVTSTMSELVTLVLDSLQEIEEGSSRKADDDDDDDAVEGGTGASTSTSSRLLHDLVLSSQSSDGGSAMASILHHAPVLRHRHVANALCRTGVPRVATLIARLAANCPTAVPCLLRGCIEAYHVQAKVAKASVLALANLSPRESSRVFLTLERVGVMWDVQLELAITADMHVGVANLLLHHLSSAKSTQEDPALEKSLTSPEADNDILTDFSEKKSHGINNKNVAPTKFTNLAQILHSDQQLQMKTHRFLHRQLSMNPWFCWGQLCLYLSAYSWFQVCVVPLASSQESSVRLPSDPSFCEQVQMLQSLHREICERCQNKTLPGTERSYRLVLCASIVALGSYLSPSISAEDESAAQRLLSDLFEQSSLPPCRRCQVFLARLAWLIKNSFAKELCDLVVDTLAMSSTSESRSPVSKIEDGLISMCALAGKEQAADRLESASRRGIEMESLRADLSALELCLQYTQASDMVVARTALDFIQHLLKDPGQCQLMVQRKGIGDVIFEGAMFIANSGLLAVPLVLPLQIEWLGGRVDLEKMVDAASPLGPVECQFILQLTYCFALLELNPSSPFSFDPRTLPLKEVLYICDNPLKSISGCLCNRLKEHIGRRAPDIGPRLERWKVPPNLEVQNYRLLHVTRHELVRRLSVTIQAYCSTGIPSVPDGIKAEHFFALCGTHLADHELHETVVASFFAVPHAPLPIISFAQLCRDPLVMLKLPLRVWKCAGMRRLALFVLSNLLESNAELIKENCKANDVALEMLAARNCLVARCLLRTVSGVVSENNRSIKSPFCAVLASFLRRLIAETSGIAAMMLKDNFPDPAQDWLVEFIPETMTDWQSLAAVMTDRCSLTAAERLLAADWVLRVAIAHGHAFEEEAQSLAFAALTLLVSSFFLVVGPVGVPVNALLGDDSNLDVMQASRKATLRMLRCLPHVRGRRAHLRDECGMALQKLAGLCKGETILGGFPGVPVGGRKVVVKEVYDAITKAANAMGSSVQI